MLTSARPSHRIAAIWNTGFWSANYTRTKAVSILLFENQKIVLIVAYDPFKPVVRYP
jgi:hypothetical protein